MTAQEILTQYRDLAAKTGDVYLRLEDTYARAKALEAALEACRAEKRELDAKYAEATKPAPEQADVVENTAGTTK